MGKVIVSSEKLTDIADAIRTITDSTDMMKLDAMAAKITSMPKPICVTLSLPEVEYINSSNTMSGSVDVTVTIRE